MRLKRTWMLAGAVVAFGTFLFAQHMATMRTAGQKAVVSLGAREAVLARVEVAPGAALGWHTHPGHEMTYVTDGEAEVLIAGQPPRRIATGQVFVIPAGAVHDARNAGDVPVTLMSVYVVEKGVPLASAAAEPTP